MMRRLRLWRYPEVSYAALMLVAVAIIILVVCTACGSSAQSDNNNDRPRSTPTTETGPSDAIVSSIQTVHVDGYTRKYVCFTYINHNMWCEKVSVE